MYAFRSALAPFVTALVGLGAAASAQDGCAPCVPDEPEPDAPKIWSGQAALSGAARTGNTETQEIGFEGRLQREVKRTRHLAELLFDLGQTEVEQDDGTTQTEETTNRFFGSYEQNRLLTERIFLFGDVDHEIDRFSGFNYRTVVALGVGYDVLKREGLTWSVSGGPGYRFERTDERITGEPEVTNEELAARFASRYTQQLNDNVTLSNDTDILWTDISTTSFNRTAITADLVGGLAARGSFELTHESNPPLGAVETDTVTRVALVYAFGE